MFEGIYTALVTPFNTNGSIDEAALKALVDEQIEAGIKGLVPVGSTGESPTVSHLENVRVVELVVKQAAGRVPVVAGTGSNSTAEAIEMTKAAHSLGASASLQVAPYYNKPNAEGFYRHFSSIAEAVDLPLVVYNIPGRTGKNVETATILKLAQHQNIVAVKECSGNLDQVMDLINLAPKDFSIICGDDNMAIVYFGLGAKGLISVASHLVARHLVELYDLVSSGKHSQALALHYKLLPLFRSMFIDTNPIPLKYALSQLGKIKEVYRLPLCEMTVDLKHQMNKTLSDFGLL